MGTGEDDLETLAGGFDGGGDAAGGGAVDQDIGGDGRGSEGEAGGKKFAAAGHAFTVSRLLEAEGLDGVERGGFLGGVVAEEDADQHGENGRAEHGGGG